MVGSVKISVETRIETNIVLRLRGTPTRGNGIRLIRLRITWKDGIEIDNKVISRLMKWALPFGDEAGFLQVSQRGRHVRRTDTEADAVSTGRRRRRRRWRRRCRRRQRRRRQGGRRRAPRSGAPQTFQGNYNISTILAKYQWIIILSSFCFQSPFHSTWISI